MRCTEEGKLGDGHCKSRQLSEEEEEEIDSAFKLNVKRMIRVFETDFSKCGWLIGINTTTLTKKVEQELNSSVNFLKISTDK